MTTKIPIVPQWNMNNGCVCTPDGGFLYVGYRSINFISSIEKEEDIPQIKAFHTRQLILSVDIDPHWGELDKEQVTGCEEINDKEPLKLFVVLSQDNSVQIWDFNKGCAIQGHKAHLACMRYMEGNGPSPQHAGDVFVSYMINRNVLSVDNQDIVVYCVASNSYCRRPMFVSPRHHQLTAMKCSPYNENHFAVGTSRGLVLICDLQKMVTLHTLRGNDASITSLAWNRIDLTTDQKQSSDRGEVKNNLIEAKAKPIPKPTKLTRTDTTIVDTDDIFDIYDYDYLDNEFGATPQDPKPKSELIMSDFVGIEKSNDSSAAAQFDFAEACQSLKEEINALREDQPQMSPEHVVSLEDCKNASVRDDSSSYGSENEDEHPRSDKKSSDGSLVRLVCGTPSSEESVDVDGKDRLVKQQLVCQAEIHAITEIKPDSVDNKPVKAYSNENGQGMSESVDKVKCVSPETSGDILLAFVDIDGSISIWNALTGAACDHHKVRGSHGEKNKKNTKLEISWFDSTSLIASTKSCNLQVWTMQTLLSSKNCAASQLKQYKFKESKRHSQQRNVASFGVCQLRKILWSISPNREISMEDMTMNTIKLQYGCVSTNISELRECPDDMNKIALAFSDRRIGIVDISKIKPNSIHIENFVQRIESAVTSLVWSQDCKKLAYGTMEGRIGVINVEGGHKLQPVTFNSVSGKKIYSINWQDKYLFVVCNERIAVFEDNTCNRDAYIIPDIGNVSALSVLNKYLFVGTQNGRLRLYEHKSDERSYFEYELRKEIELSSRYITDIVWSPIATNKLAVISNANNIHILEFKPLTGELEIIRKLEIKSSKAANAGAKWSNRNENLLLTCGCDGAIRVWDLSKDSDSERFVKLYHCPMNCGLFLPTDEEVLLCAGRNTSLEFIDMRTDGKDDITSKSKRSNQRTFDNVQWATKASVARNGSEIIKSPERNDLAAASSDEVSKMLEKLDIQKKDNATNVDTSIYMKMPSTLLCLTSKELNKDALDVMYNLLTLSIYGKLTENKSLCSKLFGSKSDATQLLTEELKNHQNSKTKGIQSLFMPQLNGNLKDEILKCVQTKQLCEWHVSLAPSISYNFWQKCCQAYAEQLTEQGHVLQGAVYMLAIHLQHDAIEMLIQRGYFKEAMLIARIYLQPDDPFNAKITEQWITYLYNTGNLTGAALLCLLSEQNNRAYDCLSKIRNTGPEIERVIRLLKESKNEK